MRSNAILAVSARVSLDEINAVLADSVKQIALPVGVGLTQSVEGVHRTKG